MILATLTLLAPLAALPPADALPMPPPPPGMSLVQPREKTGDPISDPEESEQIADESAELEALRALEQVALDPEADQGEVLLEALRHIGPGNPLRQRLEDVLDDSDHREDAPPELARITNVLAFDVSKIQDRYDIPVEMQPLVAEYIRFFQGPGRRWYRKWVSRSTRYLPVMQPILEAHGLPRDTVYLAMIESGFSNQAYSWAHAAGPWQFIPATGKEYGLKQDFWVDERRDPLKATDAAARYLKQLHKELGHWYLAWAGYNTGGGRVRRLCNRMNTVDFWTISAGRGLAQETKHYVPKLIAAALVSKNPSAFGFRDDEFDYLPPLEFDVVEVTQPTDLSVLADAAGVKEDDLRDLNPELKRWCTPPSTPEDPYLLRIPKGQKAQFTENYSKIPKRARLQYAEHTIKRGDTLGAIARRYGADTEAIMSLNRLRNPRSLKVNTVLMIPVPVSTRPVKQKQRNKAEAQKPSPPRADAGAVKTEVVDGRTKTIWQDRGPSAPARVAQQEKTARIHQLAPGETLWSVAQRYRVSVDDLKQWNGIRDHRALKVGQKIRVVGP